jgi:hypothetical protein
LDGAIAKLPEVYTEAVTPETVAQYTQLLSALPEEAQWWITGMGWGLEDLELDANEIALLELLVEKNVPTAMSILTSPDIIDGVTWGEVAWAQGYKVESLAALLQDDIDELLAHELVTEKGLPGINELMEMAATDFEIAKGLHLIENFGHPNQDLFAYQVPDYNTQLCVLGRLLELGVPQGYEVVAVAAALDYGSLWTIAGEEVRASIPDYAHTRISCQEETDQILQEGRIKIKGAVSLFTPATWQADHLPLEAQITMIWGAPGDLYPAEYDEWERDPNGNVNASTGPLRSFLRAFRNRPMSPEDFEWSFITPATKAGMRGYLLENDFLNPQTASNPDKLMEKIWYFYSKDPRNYSPIGMPGWPNSPEHELIDGRDVFPSYVGNIEYQWWRFSTGKRFRGSSGEAYIGGYLAQALNVPNISLGLRNHTSGYFHPHSAVFRVTESENRTDVASGSAKTDNLDVFGWWQVPWNNFRITHGNHFRLWFTRPLPYTVGEDGLPPGYIYRANVAEICDLPNYCD